MGYLNVVVCVIATILMFRVSAGIGVFALIITALNIWSLVVMHKYGGSPEIHDSYERFVITTNMLTAVIAVIMLIAAIVREC